MIRRAADALYDADNRLCHHTDCPHYTPNYCNTYPVIPDRFEECGFPRRVAQLRAASGTREANEDPAHA